MGRKYKKRTSLTITQKVKIMFVMRRDRALLEGNEKKHIIEQLIRELKFEMTIGNLNGCLRVMEDEGDEPWAFSRVIRAKNSNTEFSEMNSNEKFNYILEENVTLHTRLLFLEERIADIERELTVLSKRKQMSLLPKDKNTLSDPQDRADEE